MFSLLSKKCELVCVGVKILNVVYFGVKKSGISVFFVSAENGTGVNKKTNITYELREILVYWQRVLVLVRGCWVF